jgi:hypothetical protein
MGILEDERVEKFRPSMLLEMHIKMGNNMSLDAFQEEEGGQRGLAP